MASPIIRPFVVITSADPTLGAMPYLVQKADPNLNVEFCGAWSPMSCFSWRPPMSEDTKLFTRMGELAAVNGLPDILIVEHHEFVRPDEERLRGKDILLEYMRAVGEVGGPLPHVVLISHEGLDYLKSEKRSIQRAMPCFTRVSCLELPTNGKKIVQHIRDNVAGCHA